MFFILYDYLLAGEPRGALDVRKDVIETILKHEKLIKTEAAEIYSSIKRGSLKLKDRRKNPRKYSLFFYPQATGAKLLPRPRLYLQPANQKRLKALERSKTLIRSTSSIKYKKKQLQTSAKSDSTLMGLARKGSFSATDELIAGQSQLYGSVQSTALERDQLLKIQSSTEPPVQSNLSKQYEGHLATGLTSDVRESTSGALFHTRERSVTQSSSSPKMLSQISPQPKSLPSKPLSSTSSSQNFPLNVTLLNEDIKPSTSVSEFSPESLQTSSVISSLRQLQKSRDMSGEKKEPKRLIKEFAKHKLKQSYQERLSTSTSTSIANLKLLSEESHFSSTEEVFLCEEEQSFEDFKKKGECKRRILFLVLNIVKICQTVFNTLETI